MKSIEKKKLKYKSKDSPTSIFKQIRLKSDSYFATQTAQKNANFALWFKFLILSLFIIGAYFSIIYANSFIVLLFSYLAFGGSFLILGINIGHDAAHHCVTGKSKTDNNIFTIIFGLQGLSGYMWQIRHNFSHHIFPNIYESDVDMELSEFILLNTNQKPRWFHEYQHIYAPFMYLFFSLAWIFVQDFKLLNKKKQANLTFKTIPFMEWVKLIAFKIIYISFFLVIPYMSTSFSIWTVLSAFIIMHFCLSLFLSFTFFISHHVTEVDYFESDEISESVDSSWLKHQIITTIDFNPDSRFAHFLFGGFNLHIAHHIFPDVSHIHYPALTKIIRETLEENNVTWYKSFTFFEGVRSHIAHLKLSAKNIIQKQSEIPTVLSDMQGAQSG